MTRRVLILIGALVLIIGPPSAGAVTYYVDAQIGNDTWNGQCQTWDGGICGPWKSFRHALRLSYPEYYPSQPFYNPGDQILLKRGQLWKEGWFFINSGSESQPIVIGAYGNAQDPRPIVRVSRSLGPDHSPCVKWVPDTSDPNSPDAWEMVQNDEYCGCQNGLCGPACDQPCACYCGNHEEQYCAGTIDRIANPTAQPPTDCGFEQLVFNLDTTDERLGRKRRLEDKTLDQPYEWRFNRYVTETPEQYVYHFKIAVYSESNPDSAFQNIELPFGTALGLGDIYRPSPVSAWYVTVRDIEFQLGIHTVEMKLARGIVLDNVRVKYGYDLVRMGPQTDYCTIRNSEFLNPYHVGVNCLGAPDLGDISPVACSYNLFEKNHFKNDPVACNYAEAWGEYDADCGMLFTIYGREPVYTGYPIIYGAVENVVRYNFFENNQGDRDNTSWYYEGRGGGGIRISGQWGRFYYNIVANGRESGVGISSSGPTIDGVYIPYISRDNWIFNNTIYGNWGPGVVQIEHPCKDKYNDDCTDNWTGGNLIYNNILFDNDRERFSWSLMYPPGYEPNSCPDYDSIPPDPGPPPQYTYHVQVLINAINTAGEHYEPSLYKNNLILRETPSNGTVDVAHYRTRADILADGCMNFLTVPEFDALPDHDKSLEKDPLFAVMPPILAADFDLKSTSPAINYGLDVWSMLKPEEPGLTAKDYRGDAVSPEATPDVGAYEGACGLAPGGADGAALGVLLGMLFAAWKNRRGRPRR